MSRVTGMAERKRCESGKFQAWSKSGVVTGPKKRGVDAVHIKELYQSQETGGGSSCTRDLKTKRLHVATGAQITYYWWAAWFLFQWITALLCKNVCKAGFNWIFRGRWHMKGGGCNKCGNISLGRMEARRKGVVVMHCMVFHPCQRLYYHHQLHVNQIKELSPYGMGKRILLFQC